MVSHFTGRTILFAHIFEELRRVSWIGLYTEPWVGAGEALVRWRPVVAGGCLRN